MKELVIIQQNLKAPKSQYNSFGKYNYRSCEDILEAVKPLLSEHNCQLTISDDIVAVGSRIYVKATATLKNSTGETEVVTGYAREEESKKGMDGSQVTGASSSYARKYALNGMFCIDDTKDSDATNDGTGTQKKASPSKPSAPKPMTAEETEYLAMALQEIRSATRLEVLTGIYNHYPMLHTNSQFMEALSSKKNEV